MSSQTPRESSLVRRYILRLYVGIGICLVLAVPAGFHSAAAISSLRNIPVEWLPRSTPLRAEFYEFVDKFGITDMAFISWPDAKLLEPTDFRSRPSEPQPRTEKQIRANAIRLVVSLLEPLTAEHAARPSTDSLTPWPEGTRPEWGDRFHRDVRELCQSETPLDWIRSGTQVRDQLMKPPLGLSDRAARARLRGSMVSTDGKQTGIMISLGQSTSDVHRQLLPMIREAIARLAELPVEQIALVGGPVDGAAVDTASIISINRYSLPASVVAAVLCWICLRSIALSVAIIGVAVIGQGMVLAMVYYSGMDMNAILIVLPPLVFVLTVSAGIHLSNYFIDIVRHSMLDSDDRSTTAVASRADLAVAASEAMRLGTRPCFLASFTTVVGLSSLALVRLQPVQVFGLVASFGVMLTLGLLILVLPGAMLFTRIRYDESASSSFTSVPSTTSMSWVDRFVRCQLRFPWLVILVFVMMTGTAMVGLDRLKTSVSVPEMFSPESDLREQYAWYEKNLGATMTTDLLLTYEATSKVPPLDQLVEVTRVHGSLLKIDSVGAAMSAVTFLPRISSASSLSAIAARSVTRKKLLDKDSSIYQLGFVARDDIDSKDLSGSESSDTENIDATLTWRITLRMFQSEDSDFGPIIDQIRTTVREVIQSNPNGSSPEVSLTGHMVVVQGSQEILLSDLFRSFMTAFGIIAVVMIVFLRSLWGGLIAMIPNLVPTAFLFGMMGWLNLPLDIGSVMTASVALGIAVDDNVHLLSRFRNFRLGGHPQREAARLALKQCGMAMLQTTIVCSTSLLVYGLSDFVPTRRFAFFMLGLLSVAWLGVSILLPAMMASSLGRQLVAGLFEDDQASNASAPNTASSPESS